MTTYRLVFDSRAKKDWDRLDNAARSRFKKKLKERLLNPKVASAKLRDMPNCYKIKLVSLGYRLVYQVQDNRVVVLVIAIGRREDQEAYDKAAAALARLGG